jgi:hypothetical protein
MSRAIETMV